METAVKARKKIDTKTLVIILTAVILVAAAILVFLKVKADRDEELRQSIINSGVFHKGITVGGVDVSGMTADAALAALAPVEDDLTKDVGFTLTDGEHVYDIPREFFTITFDSADRLAEAMLLGREGDLETLQAELLDIETNGRSFDIAYEIATPDFAPFVSGMAAELLVPALDATFTVKPLDMNEKTEAQNAVNLGLTEEESAAGTDIRDRRFDFVEGVDGVYLEEAPVMEALRARLENREYGRVDFALSPLYPTTTISTIKEALVLRSSAYTSYSKGHYGRATRVHNMTKACGLIYGTVLQPGDILSCNTILGDRYEKYGWQLAPAVIEGGANTEDQAGGGVCQVSTTMYNAVLRGDYEIVYRQAHSSRLSYVDGGLDATINTGTIDFKWSNNTAAPIYVFTWIDTENKRVWCEIYGLPFNGDFDEIELVSKRLPDINPTAPEFVVLPGLTSPYWMIKNEAKTGYAYDTFKVYKLAGAEVRTEKIATTKYNMHPLRYYVWPGYVPGTPLASQFQIFPAKDE